MEKKVHLQTEKSTLWTIEDFTPDYFEYLNELHYRIHPQIKVFGKIGIQHRDVAFFSDVSKGYKYSGTFEPAIPFEGYEFLKQLMDEINKSLKTEFNSILCNRYNSGEDYVGSHSDETNVLSNGVVAALSYGAIRTFRIKDKITGKILVDVETLPNSLLVMDGNFQNEFKHEITKSLKIKELRISLTFRKHLV